MSKSRIDNNSYYFNPNDSVPDTQADEQSMEGRVLIRGYNSSTKFKVFDINGNSIFGVDTTSPRVDCYTPNFYVNNVLYGGGFSPNDGNPDTITDLITIRTTQNGTVSNRLIIENTGTGVSTGVGIELKGHNGSVVTSGSIQVNNNNVLYNNNNASGFHLFNKAVLPSADITYACGNAFNRWLSMFSYNGNFDGAVTISGINTPGKLRVNDNSSNSIFDVDTSTNLISCGVPLRLNVNGTALNLNNTSTVTGIAFFANSGANNASMLYSSAGFTYNATLIPSATTTYDLGTSSLRWNNLFSQNVDITNTITSSAAANGTAPNRLILTNSGTGANTGVTISLNGHNGTSAQNGTISFSNTSLTFTIPSGGNYVFNATVRPSTAGTLGLGTSGNRWSSVFCTAVDSTGAITSTALTASAANAAVISNRLTLTNSGTGAGTGTQITFNGHNGTSATAATIQHNGTHFLYNATSGGDHAFNSNVRPITDNTASCGSSTNKWTAVWATNGTIQTSDQRAKNTITDEDLGLDFINQLRPVKYKFNVQYNQLVYTNVPRVDENGNPVYEQIELLDENGNVVYDENDNRVYVNGNQIIDVIQSIVPVPGTKFYHGLIAQEIDTVLTNNNLTTNNFAGLNKDDPNSYGVAYTEFIAPMIKAIQQLKQIVETQQTTINNLQDQINQILN